MVKRKSSVREKKVKRTPKKDDKKLFAFLATFFTILGFILVYTVRRNDDYIMFYAKQSLVLFIAAIAVSVIGVIPVIGFFFSVPLWIVWTVIWVMAWINALSGEKRDTWLIGELAEKIKL